MFQNDLSANTKGFILDFITDEITAPAGPNDKTEDRSPGQNEVWFLMAVETANTTTPGKRSYAQLGYKSAGEKLVKIHDFLQGGAEDLEPTVYGYPGLGPITNHHIIRLGWRQAETSDILTFGLVIRRYQKI